MRMKILLLIFTLFLISGPVGCSDVIGYSGGSVMIHCTIPKNRGYNGYFCKEPGHHCLYLKPDQSPNTWYPKGRVSVYEISGFIEVVYRDLSLEDTGSYQCGESGAWTHSVNLNVKTDKCCSGPKTVTVHQREAVTINCSYPEEFKEKPKFFSKWNGQHFTEMAHTSGSPGGRFSISEDRGSTVISVRIGDVRKHDEGVYYCGLSGDQGAANYDTFFTKINLQITETLTPPPITPTPTAAPTTPTSTVTNSAHTVSIVLVLLLIGGAALVFFIVILKKRRGSTPSARTNHSDHYEVPAVVTTPPPPKDQDLTYSTVSFHTNPGSPTYASVSISEEEPETEYAIVKHPTAVE